MGLLPSKNGNVNLYHKGRGLFAKQFCGRQQMCYTENRNVLRQPMSKNSSNLVVVAVERNDLTLLRDHLPHADTDAVETALWLAAHNGHVALIKEILPHADGIDALQALRTAARFDFLECLELLLPVCNSQSDKSEALFNASMYAANETMAALIPFSDPSQYQRCIGVCLAQHNLTGVEILARVCDLKANNSRPLQMAVEVKFSEAVDLLYPLSHPKKALKALQQKWPGQLDKWGDLETRLAQEQRDTLIKKTSGVGRGRTSKKI